MARVALSPATSSVLQQLPVFLVPTASQVLCSNSVAGSLFNQRHRFCVRRTMFPHFVADTVLGTQWIKRSRSAFTSDTLPTFDCYIANIDRQIGDPLTHCAETLGSDTNTCPPKKCPLLLQQFSEIQPCAAFKWVKHLSNFRVSAKITAQTQ